MSAIDSPKTQRTAISEVTSELADAGFSGAEEIGRGGFGVVYRCNQAALDRTVAVKVLTAEDATNMQRFVREQRAMGRLTRQPNVLGVLQVGTTTSGVPYLVTPYYPHGSLDARIRRHGPLSAAEALRVGVKLAAALETTHRLGILHRDIKPSNILITDYGEPALTDFGIARIPGAFHTTAGTIVGSPAFTAPEVLAGEAPTPAADVYGLGATLFAALTGHAAFERRNGEQVVAQFLRITTQPTPNLRGQGIDEDLSQVIEHAMNRTPEQRPSAAALGAELQQLEAGHGVAVDEIAAPTTVPPTTDRPTAQEPDPLGPPVGRKGSLPHELTSFVGRRTELTETKTLLASSRLVTLTGIGGVGKTRLALRAALGAQRDFPDGVWLVKLGQLRDGALLPGVIATAIGLRPQGKPVLEVLIDYLESRRLLLVLDNCEQIVDAAAQIADAILTACPRLRILATSREALNIGGEATLQVRPLTVPETNRDPSLRGAPRYDAVALFVERAVAAVSGFMLTEDNIAAVAEICRHLDGLPLAIELAAARLRTLAPEQILARLTDRYALLTGGSRSAPSRQQTLRWCIDWSYSLCTPPEQQVWAQLSVFAGSVELDAAEQVCRDKFAAGGLLDVLTALVDKSILIREESDGVVRFRLLGTIREYGRDKLEHAGRYLEFQRRHRDWYRKLAERADADLINPRQLGWIACLHREQSNLREALNFCLTDTEAEPDAALSFAAALQPFWLSHGLTGEARHWLDRALAAGPATHTVARAMALWRASLMADLQDDPSAASALVTDARTLAATTEDPIVHSLADLARGMHRVFAGAPARASAPLHSALDTFTAQGDVYGQIWSLLGLVWAHELQEDSATAIAYQERVLAITESCGDSVHRSYALWVTAVATWRQGDQDRALRLLRQGLQLIKELKDALMAEMSVETLAWMVVSQGRVRRAAMLLGAAQALSRSTGTPPVLFPSLAVHHENCERAARDSLGRKAFDTAHREGAAMDIDAAIDYALEVRRWTTPRGPLPTAELTPREQEVADLVSQGLTNRAIAAHLSISQRTAQGHVEHILTKFGFTSRAQIAAWIAEQGRPAPVRRPFAASSTRAVIRNGVPSDGADVRGE
ncbi:protein kinase [Nocardia sp. CA2R105]|uniref:protein kinase domain-containing protein n=1 Tax=Nocardia coffeae TaxID=2873381 RepID=UPI001CA6FFDD|nr:protein kinase [Nocardia coffeae]MBY8863536.1 protein kinase [Nocardia coffeae]